MTDCTSFPGRAVSEDHHPNHRLREYYSPSADDSARTPYLPLAPADSSRTRGLDLLSPGPNAHLREQYTRALSYVWSNSHRVSQQPSAFL